MTLNLSTRETKLASVAFAIAGEVAKIRLGSAKIPMEILLAGFDEPQLKEFIWVCTRLEKKTEPDKKGKAP